MVNYSVSLAPQDGIKVNIKYRFTETEVVNFITNLELNKPPYNNALSLSGSIHELEQYLASNFPKYTFAFKQKEKPKPSNTPVDFNSLNFKVEDEYFYLKGAGDINIQQDNLFLLNVTSAKSLIEVVKGEQKYLVLKLIQVGNKVKFVESLQDYT